MVFSLTLHYLQYIYACHVTCLSNIRSKDNRENGSKWCISLGF